MEALINSEMTVFASVLFGICLVLIGFGMKMYSPKCTDERDMLRLINASDYIKSFGILFVSFGALCHIYQTNPELFLSIFSVF